MPRQTIKVDIPELRIEPESLEHPFDWAELFGRSGRVEVEVGIGKGRFLVAAAETRPDVLHFGIEWANKYLRFAEVRSAKRGLDNVRFARVDARALVHRTMPSASVHAFYVFYPDPWPKKRHHKRRFLRRPTLDHVARVLVAGGRLHVATDHDEYWESIVETLDSHPAFERLPTFGGDEFPLPPDGTLTNFEEKYLVEGRSRHRVSWERRPDPERWEPPSIECTLRPVRDGVTGTGE